MTSSPESLVERAAREAGLAASGARCIRSGANEVYRLPGGVIARVGRRTSVASARQQVRVAVWLTAHDMTVVRPLERPGPVVIDHVPVTFWRELDSHRPATPAELGGVLRRLHALPVAPGLSDLDPFEMLGDPAGLIGVAESHRQWLAERLNALRTEYEMQQWGEPVLLHGDAWQANVAVLSDGTCVLLDLDNVSLGPREWDLIPVAIDNSDFQRVGEIEYRRFVAAYGGYDVQGSPAFRVLADLWETRWILFVGRRAATDPIAAVEFEHRLACLRGDIPKPWSWTAF